MSSVVDWRRRREGAGLGGDGRGRILAGCTVLADRLAGLLAVVLIGLTALPSGRIHSMPYRPPLLALSCWSWRWPLRESASPCFTGRATVLPTIIHCHIFLSDCCPTIVIRMSFGQRLAGVLLSKA